MSISSSRTLELEQLRERHIPRGLATAHPIVAQRASGARLWDLDGTEYIDFVGGIGVLNVGHNHPRVVRAIQAQLELLTHTCFQVAMYEPYLLLAQRLNDLAPGPAAKKTLLTTTGAEAVENAIKIARAYTGRPAVIAFSGGFHGRTLLGLSLTGRAAPYKQTFGPFAPEVYHAPYPYVYRDWDTARSLQALSELFRTQVAPDRVAAVLIEPILGEGGFVPAPEDFLRELRRITHEHGIVLIADEIQTGFGRTGAQFAIEHSGVVPDLITVAKSLAAGMPLAGVVGRAEIMDAPMAGGLGGTYGGNPLSCAAALAVLDILVDEGLFERARQIGARIGAALQSLQRRYSCIGDVRGLGAMLALELVTDRRTKAPDAELTHKIIDAARERGLLLIKAGLHDNVVRVLVPLVISEPELERAVTIFEDVMFSCVE